MQVGQACDSGRRTACLPVDTLRENEEGELIDEDQDQDQADETAEPETKKGRYDEWQQPR